MIKRQIFLAFFAVCISWGSAPTYAAKQPNVILILADDVGYEARELKDRSAADETASEKREAEAARGGRRR